MNDKFETKRYFSVCCSRSLCHTWSRSLKWFETAARFHVEMSYVNRIIYNQIKFDLTMKMQLICIYRLPEITWWWSHELRTQGVSTKMFVIRGKDAEADVDAVVSVRGRGKLTVVCVLPYNERVVATNYNFNKCIFCQK